MAGGFRPVAYAHYGAMKTRRNFLWSLGQKPTGKAAPRTNGPTSGTDVRSSGDKSARRVIPPISASRKLFWHAQDAVFENPVVRRLAGHMLLVVAARTWLSGPEGPEEPRTSYPT